MPSRPELFEMRRLEALQTLDLMGIAVPPRM
jgi:hypothetical protein